MKMRYSLIAATLICVAAAAQNTPQLPSAPTGPSLSLSQAEAMAIKNNPRIAVARLIALAEGQVIRETRSAELPALGGNITAVTARSNTRLTAGALNNPSVYQRAAAGMTLSQMVTDFGRTRNLVASAELRARAKNDAQAATQADIVLAVDEAFYRALGSQQVLVVARGTVEERQTVVDRVQALTNAKLKSTLDLSFANVALSQAKLLLLDAQNNYSASMTSLNALLGNEHTADFALVDETPSAPAPAPTDAEPLVTQAMQSRPDLASLNESYNAARKFAGAEHDLVRPTISALGSAGTTPERSDQIQGSWYGAVGVNVSIPIFNGFLFSSRAKEADLRADAAKKQIEELREAIARDVRTTVLTTQSNFERISVTQQLLEQANTAFDFAQTRYKMGLSTIVELSQAQLAQTEAQIDFANAKYAYQASLAALRYQTGQ